MKLAIALCDNCGKDLKAWLLDDATAVVCFACAKVAFARLPTVTIREGFERRTGHATPDDAGD